MRQPAVGGELQADHYLTLVDCGLSWLVWNVDAKKWRRRMGVEPTLDC